MKYIIGFFIGVIATAIFFTMKLKTITATDQSQNFSNTELATDAVERMPDDFEKFYIQFHEDSLYQINHVLFPLRGLPTNADSLTVAAGNFHWQQEDWTLHKPFSSNKGEYSRDFIKLDDELITEDIYTKDGFGMQRRFMKTDGEWYLIFYSAMNKMR